MDGAAGHALARARHGFRVTAPSWSGSPPVVASNTVQAPHSARSGPVESSSTALWPTMSGRIAMRDVTVEFGEGATAVRALSSIDLRVDPGEFVSVLGPSGCGKSTIVGAVAGFTRVTSGELSVDALPVAGPG